MILICKFKIAIVTIELLPTLVINLEGHMEVANSLVKLTCMCPNLHFTKGGDFFVWCDRAQSSCLPLLLVVLQFSISTMSLVL